MHIFILFPLNNKFKIDSDSSLEELVNIPSFDAIIDVFYFEDNYITYLIGCTIFRDTKLCDSFQTIMRLISDRKNLKCLSNKCRKTENTKNDLIFEGSKLECRKILQLAYLLSYCNITNIDDIIQFSFSVPIH